MGWERARKPEQKAERRQAILKAARQLFATFEYDAISLNGIARQAGISKPNVYRYFATREEIFLTIFATEQREFAERLTQRILRIRSKEKVERIADAWVEEALQSPMFLELLPQLMTSLEKNSSVQQIAGFKQASVVLFDGLVQAMTKSHPELSFEQWAFIARSTLALMTGLWPMTNQTENVLEAMKVAGMDQSDWQFADLLKRSMVALVNGTGKNEK